MCAAAKSSAMKHRTSGNHCWGELICSFEGNTTIPLKGMKYAFGRSSDNDYVVDLPGLKSQCFCYFWKDSSNKIWYCDQSPYGTYLKRTKKTVKMQSVSVEDGDTFYILKRKNAPGSFFFYITVKLKQQQQPIGDAAAAQSEDELCAQLLEDDWFDSQVFTLLKGLEEQDEIGDTPSKKGGKKDSGKKTRKDETLSSATVSEPPASQPKIPKRDALEDALLCGLCLEILYDPVSLQPCMHCYCAGCYSSWMQESSKCPQCRNNVERIGRNYVVSNVIDAYLEEHPEKKRSSAEIERLNKANKVTGDMMSMQQVQKSVSFLPLPTDYDSGDNMYETDSYEDVFDYFSEYDDPDYLFDDVIHIFQRPTQYSFVPLPHCRQCPNPNNRGSNSEVSSSSNSAHSSVNSAPSTSGASSATYVCSFNQTHIKCQCCKSEMPDCRVNNCLPDGVPPQQCTSCNRSYCHLYWECRRAGCKGCLNKFQEMTCTEGVNIMDVFAQESWRHHRWGFQEYMNFGTSCLATLLTNRYESSILKNYLESKGLTWKHLLKRCLECLDSRRYVLQGTLRVTSSTVLCYVCAMKSFKQLAFHFRKDIPVQDLPVHVTNRPNCWWGKDCRMQRKNNTHARRYNHISEATRFL